MSTTQALSAKFTKSQTKFRMNVLKDSNMAQAVPHIPTVEVEDRLDEVLGVFGWSAEYVEIHSENPPRTLGVRCRLTVTDPESSKTAVREGFSTFTEFSDMALKAAYSDALRAAASKFGVGRYLYRFPLKSQPIETEGGRRSWKEPPVLPEGFYQPEDESAAGATEVEGEPEAAGQPSEHAPEEGTPPPKAGSTGEAPPKEAKTEKTASPEPKAPAIPEGDIPGLNTSGMTEETVAAIKDILGKVPNVSPSTIRNYLKSAKAKARFNEVTLAFLLAKVDTQEAAMQQAATA